MCMRQRRNPRAVASRAVVVGLPSVLAAVEGSRTRKRARIGRESGRRGAQSGQIASQCTGNRGTRHRASSSERVNARVSHSDASRQAAQRSRTDAREQSREQSRTRHAAPRRAASGTADGRSAGARGRRRANATSSGVHVSSGGAREAGNWLCAGEQPCLRASSREHRCTRSRLTRVEGVVGGGVRRARGDVRGSRPGVKATNR